MRRDTPLAVTVGGAETPGNVSCDPEYACGGCARRRATDPELAGAPVKEGGLRLREVPSARPELDPARCL